MSDPKCSSKRILCINEWSDWPLKFYFYCLHQFPSLLITLPLNDSFFIWLRSGFFAFKILISTTFLPCLFCILSLEIILQTWAWRLWEKAEYGKCLIFPKWLANICHSVIVMKYWTILRIPTWNISIKLITCFVNLQTTEFCCLPTFSEVFNTFAKVHANKYFIF